MRQSGVADVQIEVALPVDVPFATALNDSILVGDRCMQAMLSIYGCHFFLGKETGLAIARGVPVPSGAHLEFQLHAFQLHGKWHSSHSGYPYSRVMIHLHHDGGVADQPQSIATVNHSSENAVFCGDLGRIRNK